MDTKWKNIKSKAKSFLEKCWLSSTGIAVKPVSYTHLNTDPRTAVKSVTRNTITFFGSMEDAVRPALEAAVPASSSPTSATTGPIAAGGSTTSIHLEPNLRMIKARTHPKNP